MNWLKEMHKLKCKKQFGEWYYVKILPNSFNDLDAPIYDLYTKDKNKVVMTFGSYGDMKYFVETGEIL